VSISVEPRRTIEKTIMKNPFAGLLLILTVAAFPAFWNAAAAAGPSEQDRRFVEVAARAEASRIEAAEQALTKASDKRVRIFAERILEDHRPINEELTVLASDAGIALSSDAVSDPLPKDLSSLSGNAFDHAWLDAEAKANQELIELFGQQADKGENQPLKTFAANHLASLRDHLEIARSLGAELPRRTSSE
jgi:putative membrane protein